MAGTTTNDVKDLLANLRDSPVDTAGSPDVVLGQIYTYLMRIPPNGSGEVHWFCTKADPTTVEAAIFLLRLFAYDSPQVKQWKGMLDRCLDSCVSCIHSFEEAKFSSRNTYFGAFTAVTLKGFFESFESWELSVVLEKLSRAGFTNASSTEFNIKNISDFSSVILYRMVSNWTIFCNHQIQSIIQRYPPRDVSPTWPSNSVPPGVFLLRISDSPDLRQWAQRQISNCSPTPMEQQHFTPSHHAVLNYFSMAANDNPDSSLKLVANATELWKGLESMLKLIPVEVLNSSSQSSDMCHLVAKHLHDNGPQFVEILKCFQLLLKRLDSGYWIRKDADNPQIVFDAVRDNPSFFNLILNGSDSPGCPWYISWITEFLHTIAKLDVYGEVFVKAIDFLCRQLQHERFGGARVVIMESAVHVLLSAFKKAHTNADPPHKKAVVNALDIHTETLINVAFGSNYEGLEWNQTRTAVRSLISIVLRGDLEDTSAAIARVRDVVASASSSRKSVLPLSIRKQMWTKLYSSLQTRDVDGVSTIITLASRIAHIDTVRKTTFERILADPENKSSHGFLSVADAIDGINMALATVRNGILGAVSRFVEFNTPTSCFDIFQKPEVAKSLTILLLSPNRDLQASSQALVGMAFDVDSRSECFRALLENVPDAALDGLFHALNIYLSYAAYMPEACSVSQSLVLCLTDVVEILCSAPDGLLHSARFLQSSNPKGPASRLPELWKLMTQSLSVLYKRAPGWAQLCDLEEMTAWMRDALMFMREILAQWRVIETAANSCDPASSERKTGTISSIGKQMVEHLQSVLYDMLHWLRLTDEELLHQTFALLETLLELFRDVHILPRTETIKKIEKMVNSKSGKTRLDASRILRLEQILAFYTTEDGDIQILPESTVLRRKTGKTTSGITKAKAEPASGKHTKTDVRPDQMQERTSKYPRPVVTKDQHMLDTMGSVPSFRKPSGIMSTVGMDGRPKHVNKGPKNEALVAKATELSASESDSDDESGVGGLAALSRLATSPKIKKQEPRRQIKTLDYPAQTSFVKKRVDEREQRRREMARLKPNISGLHRAILSWDYNHDGPMPPGSDVQLHPVPDIFNDYNHYFKAFEPLLLAECWAQLLQAKEEKSDIYECKISSRQYSDIWIDLDISILDSVRRDWYLAETDVVLLRRADKFILGKTQSYRASPHGIQAIIRCYTGNNADPGLQVNSTWKLNKVFSLSTIHREYGALVSLQYYDFCDSILRPQLYGASKEDQKELHRVMSTYQVNKPQASAILNSFETKGFALIQGPPGTGKTSTICGLVGRFMATRCRPAVPIVPGKAPGSLPVSKVLICAPSNAAIDEVASRLKDGYKGSERSSNLLKVVRIGTEQSINVSVKDISLDYLVDQILDSPEKSSKDANSEIIALRRELDSVKSQRQQKIDEKTALFDNSAKVSSLEIEIQQLNAKRISLNQQLDRLKDQQKSNSRTVDAVRRQTRKKVLQDADVICATLSGAGHEILEELDFEMIIIDEAAQAIELSSLIPLKYRCARCVMVGDPKQLPPTVISQQASKYLYNQSLFVRLQKQRPDAVHLLSIQYRMHPDISALPSRIFYQGRLLDGPDMKEKTSQPWQHHPKFGTYRFFNVQGIEEQDVRSIKNISECKVAVALYRRLQQEFSSENLDFRVGVVSMYKAQVTELRRQFIAQFGADIVERIHFHTVDGFQGQEKSVIILSCVRAGPGLTTVGFLSDVRRMNVALTRAKSSLFILGNAPTLERSDENWRNIVLDARSRSVLVEVNASYFTTPISYVPPSTPKKKAATKPALSVPIPDDLITPSEFKTKLNIKDREVPAQPASHDNTSQLEDAKSSYPSGDAPINSTAIQPRGVKRPADTEHPPPPAPSAPHVDNVKARSQPPPVKRTKQKQSTMFIPKKRPNPGGDSSTRRNA